MVHFAGADLNLVQLAPGPEDGRVERLVAVGFGAGAVVLDALLKRRPLVVDDAEHVVALGDGVHQHAHREEVVDLLERLVAPPHLLVDGPQVLRPAGDLEADQPGARQLLGQRLAQPLDGALALRLLRAHLARQRPVLVVLEKLEGEILELGLHPGHPEAVRERRVDLARLERDAALLLHIEMLERAHVVQPIGQFDDDDARVIIIKLADRLHNMRTLEHLDVEKQRRIALETREIYAPLAHRFGMAGVKAEFEDLAFKFLEHDEYRALSRKVRAKKAERERTIERLREPLAEELTRAGLVGFEITGRPKNLWSIYKKMRRRDKPFEEIYDLLAVRVLVNTIPECYHVLGIIHHEWTPLQERIKDYIASPKSNGYQSLHTTVFGPGGQLYEIQIRTREMHHTAEYGIAAHWLFKE